MRCFPYRQFNRLLIVDHSDNFALGVANANVRENVTMYQAIFDDFFHVMFMVRTHLITTNKSELDIVMRGIIPSYRHFKASFKLFCIPTAKFISLFFEIFLCFEILGDFCKKQGNKKGFICINAHIILLYN